jgi:hypothetical protein
VQGALHIPVEPSAIQGAIVKLLNELEYEHEVPSLSQAEREAVVLVLLLLLRRVSPALGRWLAEPRNASAYLRLWKDVTALGSDELAALQLPFLPPPPSTDSLQSTGLAAHDAAAAGGSGDGGGSVVWCGTLTPTGGGGERVDQGTVAAVALEKDRGLHGAAARAAAASRLLLSQQSRAAALREAGGGDEWRGGGKEGRGHVQDATVVAQAAIVGDVSSARTSGGVADVSENEVTAGVGSCDDEEELEELEELD